MWCEVCLKVPKMRGPYESNSQKSLEYRNRIGACGNPWALRHAGELKFRRVLSQLGVSTPKFLPFGCEVLVRTKIWRHRAQPWKLPVGHATVFGPVSSMPLSSTWSLG